jgi:hypothetical protein
MMNQTPEGGKRDNNEGSCDSLDSEIVELKDFDNTVRPMEEWLRKALEKKGIISRARPRRRLHRRRRSSRRPCLSSVHLE